MAFPNLFDRHWALAASAVALLSGALASAQVAPAEGQEIDNAIALFDRLDDRAASAFRQVLAANPPPRIAARAHVYLGLIALNDLDTPRAAAELREALLIDPVIELPLHSSPKAAMLLSEAKVQVTRQLSQPSGNTPSPDGLLVPSSEESARVQGATVGTPAPHSHVLAFVLAGAAAAAAGVAVFGGVQVVDYGSMVNAPARTYDTAQISSARASATFWSVGWIVAAVAGAAAAGGAVLTW